MICPKCGQDDLAERANSCPNCGPDIPKNPQPITQITVTQEVKNAQGGKVTAVEIGEVKGDIHIDFRDKDEERDRRNKLILLQKVKDFWIKGVLERSIHGAFLIEIGKEEQPKAVERPWSRVIYSPDQLGSTISPDKKIIEIFDDAIQSLLILGEPGSGKTTEMLELARDALAQAEKDSSIPIPVVFNLSSWTDPKQTIAEWLIRELNEKYQVGKKIGRQWVEGRDLMFMLDGLDEVNTDKREACAEAINAFLQEASCPIAVCSRSLEYHALKVKLILNKAILLQPLSPEQIECHLSSSGPTLSMLQTLLKNDPMLLELAQTPLMLSVMSIAYKDMPPYESAKEEMGLEVRRRHLFKTYVDKMFALEGRSKSERYTKGQTIEWLSWLSREMIIHGQTIFLLGDLKPSWIPIRDNKTRMMNWFMQSLNFPIFILGLLYSAYWLFSFLLGYNASVILIYVLIVGLAAFLFVMVLGIIEILTGIPVELIEEDKIIINNIVKWSWKQIVVVEWIWRLYNALYDIPQSIRYSHNKFNPSIIIASLSYIVSVFLYIIGIIGVFCFLALPLLVHDYLFSFFGLSILILSGLKDKEIEPAYPNQGIWLTTKKSVKIASILSLGFGLTAGLSAPNFFLASFIAALYFGFFLIFFMVGGFNIILHYELRLALFFCKNIPWNLVNFLEYCVERIFLQKVGGGYIFVHRMLMEYFAELESETIGKG